jgi:hypothetical protein
VLDLDVSYHLYNSLPSIMQNLHDYAVVPYDLFLFYSLVTLLSVQALISAVFLMRWLLWRLRDVLYAVIYRSIKHFILSFEYTLGEYHHHFPESEVASLLLEARLVEAKKLKEFLLLQLKQQDDPHRCQLALLLYTKMKFQQQDQRWLKSPFRWYRLMGLKNSYLLAQHKANTKLELANFHNYRERLVQILGALHMGSISVDQVITLLNGLALERRINELPLLHVLHSCGDALFQDLLFHWDDLKSEQVQRLFLQVAVERSPAQARQLIDQALPTAGKELAIGIAMALIELKSERVDYLEQLLRSPHWEVRAQAVKLLSFVRRESDKESLVRLIQEDASQWVQYNVGQFSTLPS